MKLNIYNGDEIVKTYEKDSYRLRFGVVEDVARAVNLDELKEGTEAEILRMIAKLVITSLDTIKGLMMDIFPGLTNEEIRDCSVDEMAMVIFEVIEFTIKQLNIRGNKQKNLMRGKAICPFLIFSSTLRLRFARDFQPCLPSISGKGKQGRFFC